MCDKRFKKSPGLDCVLNEITFTFTFNHLADAFVQSDVQGRDAKIPEHKIPNWHLKTIQLSSECRLLT